LNGAHSPDDQKRGGNDDHSMHYQWPTTYPVNYKPRSNVSQQLNGVTDLDNPDRIIDTSDGKVVSKSRPLKSSL
jgi:hypothetical protein